MAKIAIDIRNIGRNRTGSETVVQALTRFVIHNSEGCEIVLITDTSERTVLDSVSKKLGLDKLPAEKKARVSVRSLWAPHRALWILLSVPYFVRTQKIDVYHTEYIVPFFLQKSVHVLTHIHDVSFAVPGIRPMIATRDRIFLDLLIGRSLQRADTIIAVSDFTAQEISKYYPLESSKVVQINNAADTLFVERAADLLRIPKADRLTDRVRRKYNLPKKYFFSVGTMQPRKNIPFAINSFLSVAPKMPEVSLVLGGKKAHNFDEAIESLAKKKQGVQSAIENIHFTGYIAEEDLPEVYAGAIACITPSLYEGFGVPILEAFATETVVLAADIPAYREVAGSGALFFNVDTKKCQKTQIDQCAAAIYTIWSDKKMRSHLVSEGIKQMQKYSWTNSGVAFLKILEQDDKYGGKQEKESQKIMKKRELQQGKKSYWKKIFIALAVIVFLIVGLLGWKAYTFTQALSDKDIWSSIGKKVSGAETALKGEEAGRINIALIGMRGYGETGGGLLADTIMVVSIIKNDNDKLLDMPYKISALSVPRDLLVEGPDGRLGKINAVFFHGEKASLGGGGIDAMKQVLGKVTGAPIHYGVAINFEGFSQIVDTLGGVNVTLKKEFTEPLQFNQEHVCDGDKGGVFSVPTGETQKKFGKNGKITAEYPLCYNSSPECGGVFTVEAGDQVLNGEDALCYVRSRMTSSDFDRARRQQEVIDSLRQQALSLNLIRDIGRVNEILKIVGENVQYDMELWELEKFFDLYTSLGQSDFSQAVLDDGVNGYLFAPGPDEGYDADYGYILRPKDQSFKEIHDLFASFGDEEDVQDGEGTESSGS